jgi:hypothetical protein
MLPERNHSPSLAIMANNEGVIHLQRNEHRSAIASFEFAIQHLNGLVNGKGDSNDHFGTQRKQELLATPRANPLQDELSFLFRQAVALRDDSVSSCQYCVEDIAAIIYNFGFAYHILGLDKSSRKFLHRGLFLYELALSLLWRLTKLMARWLRLPLFSRCCFSIIWDICNTLLVLTMKRIKPSQNY